MFQQALRCVLVKDTFLLLLEQQIKKGNTSLMQPITGITLLKPNQVLTCMLWGQAKNALGTSGGWRNMLLA